VSTLLYKAVPARIPSTYWRACVAGWLAARCHRTPRRLPQCLCPGKGICTFHITTQQIRQKNCLPHCVGQAPQIACAPSESKANRGKDNSLHEALNSQVEFVSWQLDNFQESQSFFSSLFRCASTAHHLCPICVYVHTWPALSPSSLSTSLNPSSLLSGRCGGSDWRGDVYSRRPRLGWLCAEEN
jgi:hypothetical protein